MPSLQQIFHNIADHTETLLRVYTDQGLDPEFVARLLEHLFLEEQENTKELQSLTEDDSAPLVRKLLDHSFFIQKMIKDNAMPSDLKRELLDHFMEEHGEWQTQAQKGPVRAAWTVGPLWQQGE